MSYPWDPTPKYECVNGTPVGTDPCRCDPGWTSEIHQDPLAGLIVLCNIPDYSLPPGKGRINPIFIVILILGIGLFFGLLGLIVLRYCFPKKIKMNALSEEQRIQVVLLNEHLRSVVHLEGERAG